MQLFLKYYVSAQLMKMFTIISNVAKSLKQALQDSQQQFIIV